MLDVRASSPNPEGALHLYFFPDQGYARGTAFDPGLGPGVNGCLSKRTTYARESFCNGAIECVFVRFAVEKVGSQDERGRGGSSMDLLFPFLNALGKDVEQVIRPAWSEESAETRMVTS